MIDSDKKERIAIKALELFLLKGYYNVSIRILLNGYLRRISGFYSG